MTGTGGVDGWREHVGAVLGRPVVTDFGTVRVDVAAPEWAPTVRAARERLGCTFFDWLTAVDELHDGFRVVCHLAVPPGAPAARPSLRRLLVRTLLPRDRPAVASVAEVFGGAAWHEREVSEMFGVAFIGRGDAAVPRRLLLPEGFAGHPLRKEFVLASRVVAPWPGAKEPGESDASLVGPPSGGPVPGRAGRRRSRPPGVPMPDEWGPREPGSAPPQDRLAAAVPGRRPRPRGAR